MPISHDSKLYAVEDAKIAKLLTDPSGGSATYDTLIDVPGIKTVSLTFDLENKELRGDNRRLDSDTTLAGVTVAFSHAKLSLNALAVMLGGTNTDSGSTPNQKATFTRLGADALNYFKLEAKTPTAGVDTGTGDAHMVFYKLKLATYELGFAEEDYQIFSGTAQGVVMLSNDKYFDIVFNETAAAIA